LKRLISISLRLLISGVLLALLFREHDLLSDIAPRLRALLTNWPWTLVGIAFAFLSLFLTAVRWHIILRGQVPDLPFHIVLRTEIISAFFNISSVGVVGGDTYKIMSLSRRLPGQTMPVSVSLVLDHLTGLLSVAVLFAACMLLRASHWHEIRRHLPVRQEVVHAAPALEAPCREMWRTAKLNMEGGIMAALGNDW
jgi:uncharacterized membrane protein YbhN (UPF0104 family)